MDRLGLRRTLTEGYNGRLNYGQKRIGPRTTSADIDIETTEHLLAKCEEFDETRQAL